MSSKTKWKVQIPPPSAKRMHRRKLIITTSDGWGDNSRKEIDLTPNQTEYEFVMDDEREWIQSTSCNDGPVFDVRVESTNSTGSRTETRLLVPEVV
jgi:hypothetical protein